MQFLQAGAQYRLRPLKPAQVIAQLGIIRKLAYGFWRLLIWETDISGLSSQERIILLPGRFWFYQSPTAGSAFYSPSS
jgi:hypothetical protein